MVATVLNVVFWVVSGLAFLYCIPDGLAFLEECWDDFSKWNARDSRAARRAARSSDRITKRAKSEIDEL